MEHTIPWWQSKVIIGAIISLVGKALVISGVITAIAPEDADAIANTVVLITSGVGDLIAMVSRIRQTRAPAVTLTKEK